MMAGYFATKATESLQARLNELQDSYARRRQFAAQQADYGDWEPTNQLIGLRDEMNAIKAELARRGCGDA